MAEGQDSEQHEVQVTSAPGLDTPTVPDDLASMLDLLAQTIVEALGFGVAVVNIARPDGSLEVVSVAGDTQARDVLLGTVDTGETWDQLLAVSEPWGRLRFADHRNEAANIDILTWIPDIEPIEAEDAWHPEDALFAPLTAKDGALLGTLSVDLPHDGRRPNPATCRALEAFAVSTALAIEHATLRSRAEASERRFKELAAHDPLTGVGDRSMLVERLRHAVSARPEKRSMMALVFIDLDSFKDINDRHSHTAGDQVLKAVAERIRLVSRPHDTVVRWGGDEFLVLLEHLDDEDAALVVAQRISAAVSEPIRHCDHLLQVTASVGVAFRRPVDEFDADELVRLADAAMYQVKAGGRDGFAVFEPDDSKASAVSR